MYWFVYVDCFHIPLGYEIQLDARGGREQLIGRIRRNLGVRWSQLPACVSVQCTSSMVGQLNSIQIPLFTSAMMLHRHTSIVKLNNEVGHLHLLHQLQFNTVQLRMSMNQTDIRRCLCLSVSDSVLMCLLVAIIFILFTVVVALKTGIERLQQEINSVKASQKSDKPDILKGQTRNKQADET